MSARRRVRWGILGAASIALRRVIRAMQRCQSSEVAAIASRSQQKAEGAALAHNIPKAYGSYDALLADPTIEVIYNPLPNHLHVPWSIKALEAGKHVLCEKPLACSVADAQALHATRDLTGKKVGEGFMVLTHPRWLRTRELIRSGAIGALRAAEFTTSYFNRDPANVRNILEFGGGALLDIGCYSVVFSRFIFGTEPTRVFGAIERDPEMKIDRLTSAILEFPSGQSTFTCGTQMAYHQSAKFLGATGRIELEMPLNPPTDRPTQILIDDGRDAQGGGASFQNTPPAINLRSRPIYFRRLSWRAATFPCPLKNRCEPWR